MPTNGVRALGAFAAALTLVGVTACGSDRDPLTGGSDPQPSGTGSTAIAPGDAPSPTTPPEPDPVVLTANVADKATKVTVDTLVKVTAKTGTLTKVKVAYRYTDRAGKTAKGALDGALSKNKASWTATERLEPAATYAISMTGKNPPGRRAP